MPWVSFKFQYSPSVEILVAAGLKITGMDVGRILHNLSFSSET